MFPIFNLAVMPVCSKCLKQMQTEEMKFEDQSAVVTCANPECIEHGSRYRVVIPTMQGERIHDS